MKEKSFHNTLRKSAIILLFILALNALAAGYSFITDPSGNGIGITTDYLSNSAPFKDYLIPGIVLFVVIGVFSFVISILVIRRHKHYPLLLMMQGSVLVGWIVIQLTMVIAFHPLHAIIASAGAILIAIGLALQKKDKLSQRLVIEIKESTQTGEVG